MKKSYICMLIIAIIVVITVAIILLNYRGFLTLMQTIATGVPPTTTGISRVRG